MILRLLTLALHAVALGVTQRLAKRASIATLTFTSTWAGAWCVDGASVLLIDDDGVREALHAATIYRDGDVFVFARERWQSGHDDALALLKCREVTNADRDGVVAEYKRDNDIAPGVMA